MLEMYDLIQAKISYTSALQIHNTQTAMNNEKQEINTAIQLDGYSLPSETKRLNQIQNQTQKLTGSFSDTINSAQDKTQEAAKSGQQDKDKDTGGVNQDGTSDQVSGQDDLKGSEPAAASDTDKTSGVSQTAQGTNEVNPYKSMDIRA